MCPLEGTHCSLAAPVERVAAHKAEHHLGEGECRARNKKALRHRERQVAARHTQVLALAGQAGRHKELQAAVFAPVRRKKAWEPGHCMWVWALVLLAVWMHRNQREQQAGHNFALVQQVRRPVVQVWLPVQESHSTECCFQTQVLYWQGPQFQRWRWAPELKLSRLLLP